MEQLSDRDIRDAACKTKLSHAELRHLYLELDIDDTDVERAEGEEKLDDFKLKAIKVLKLWRNKNGNRANRSAILAALNELNELEFIKAKEILEEKWAVVRVSTPQSEVDRLEELQPKDNRMEELQQSFNRRTVVWEELQPMDGRMEELNRELRLCTMKDNYGNDIYILHQELQLWDILLRLGCVLGSLTLKLNTTQC